jgi:flavorubredoxin
MRALVVYESMFGNTQAIASAVAEGLSGHMQVDVVEVGEAPTTTDADLVVAGGPTHAFSMSRANTRQSAAQQADGREIVSRGRGLREWLDEAGAGLRGRPVTTFDTKVMKVRLPGSAARAAQKRLRRFGARIVSPAHNFDVLGTTGPLGDGELARARDWGAELAALVLADDRPAGRFMC